MELSKEDVIKIAILSKLEFNDDEIENFRSDLSEILNYMNELNELDTEGINPLFNVLDLDDVTRKDEVRDSLKQEEVLKNAPDKDENFIIVPKIIG
ncbi:Asp-tRNA(Asn)/Glu-tRNA(Gln) amidotransferase subunit GatC [Sebaldella sp. S0638]|uniref:Asp-tRNA(Asn)/Glu-tRNA(Gln) amidotransferase subunit GatC n=1 Tax=Sebaldella sp. S0638 TaxID=2957809 RepID=UPI00209FD03A|nr:Asp-tRNA(Asn)/Glu-tRNA(Gln) amidotransferase subunit GatC [Sebaldella sp. S0638]